MSHEDAPRRTPLPQNAKIQGDVAFARMTEGERAGFAEAGARVPAGGIAAAVESVLAAQPAPADELPDDLPPVTLDETAIRHLSTLRGEELERAVAGFAAIADVARNVPAVAPAGTEPPDVDAVLKSLAARGGAAGLAAVAAASPPAVEPEPKTPRTVEPDDAGAKPVARVCPRCKWDSSRLDPVDATADDRLRWTASLYGARFVKTYPLLGGSVLVSFRAMTTRELDAAYARAAAEARDDAASFFARVGEYHFYLCLEAVEFPRDGVRLPVPHAACREADGTPDFAKLKTAVTTDVVTTESLSRMANAKFQAFRRLVEWMEAAADDPDFLAGIGATV